MKCQNKTHPTDNDMNASVLLSFRVADNGVTLAVCAGCFDLFRSFDSSAPIVEGS